METQIKIDKASWLTLSTALHGSDLLAVEFLELKRWKVAILDDSNLEDSDVGRLEQAI